MPLASLYHHAELYDAVRPVDEPLAEMIEDELARVGARAGESLFDPACGPGGWLARFAARGFRVAGNDLSGDMVRLTRERLDGRCLEVTQLDMRELAFAHAPYDVAVEPSGVLGELDDASFERHLASVRSQLRAGGAYVLVTPVDSDPAEHVPELLYDHAAPTSDGRTARGTYWLVSRVPHDRWRVRRAIRVEDASGVQEVVDEYVLHMRGLGAVLEAARRTRFEPLAMRCADTGATLHADRPFVGEGVFVLRAL
jgi:SAM-dependent methyltransferase